MKQEHLLWVAVGVLALGLGWSTVRQGALQDRLDQLESTAAIAPLPLAGRASLAAGSDDDGRPRAGRRRARAASASESAPGAELDPAEDPALREAFDQAVEASRERMWEQHREERAEAVRAEAVHAELDAFVDDEGLSNTQAESLHAAVDDFTDRGTALRDLVQAGEIARFEAREERHQDQAELEAQVGEILGEERGERLLGRLPGGGGRGPW